MTNEPKKGDLRELKYTKFPGGTCRRTPSRRWRIWLSLRKLRKLLTANQMEFYLNRSLILSVFTPSSSINSVNSATPII